MYYFHNKKKLQKFMNDTNKSLSMALIEVNDIYRELLIEFRNNWFIIDFTHDYWGGFETIEKNMNHLVNRSTHSINSNYFVFSWFRSIIKELSNIAYKLKQVYVRYNKHTESYRIECLHKRIVNLKEEVFNWDVPKKLIRMADTKELSREFSELTRVILK
jgi:hypothetical protein